MSSCSTRSREQCLGGQAFWSLGGLFLVDTPEQRRMGIRDSHDLAWQDWLGSAAFDRAEDHWPRRWAEAYVNFAAGEKRSWLHEQGHRLFPVVGWAERGDGRADGHGNSVPRFHVTWGTGPGVVEPVRAPGARGCRQRPCDPAVPAPRRRAGDDRRRRHGRARGRARGQLHRARPGQLASGGRATSRSRPRPWSSRRVASAATTTWCARRGPSASARRRSGWWPGVPAHVDGRMLQITQAHGGNVINPDRMWHYAEGLHNWNPVWDEPRHPDPARSLLAVARRARQAPAAAALPRLRHPRHAGALAADRLRLLLVHPDPEDHREGVRPLGLGAEPRPHRQEHPAGARPRETRRARPGRGVQDARRRLRRRREPR